MTTANGGLRYGPPTPFHPVECGPAVTVRLAHSLPKVRAFTLSTHDGERWATPPSADFCPIPPGVTARRAVWVSVGSGIGDP